MRLLKKYSNYKQALVTAEFAPNFLGRLASGVKQGIQKIGAKGAQAAVEGGEAVAQQAQQAPGLVDKVKDGAVTIAKTVTGMGIPADEAAMRQLVEDAKNHRNGVWGKAMALGTLGMGTLGTMPMVAGMVTPDATTRAVEAMRKEDKLREAKGLIPLSVTPELLKEKAQEAGAAIQGSLSQSTGNVRTVNPLPNRRLPGELPPNSLM